MQEIIEKITLYAVGGAGGAVAGTILLTFQISPVTRDESTAMLIIMSILGILVSVAIVAYRQERIAKKNGKVRNEIVSLITHEMRTGLTSTGWTIQFILDNYTGVLKESDRKMLQDAIASIRTTVVHAVNLLDVSILDIGKLSISLAWVTLAEVEEMINETIERYSVGTRQRGIEFRTEVRLDQKRQVEVDMLRLRIILENLLENALQYTSEGKNEITLSVTNDDTHLHVRVQDTGIGIPKGEQGKIFSEFFRASNARKRLSTGSGIGLYMSDQYVKAHRGTIRFESIENKGTTFLIAIPLKTEANVNEFLTKM
ncbi:HAMP domain-containing histidine kinase [Candidatus Kaiserbacteria bacterium]|nr:HAMP domain-containing histidine kinase [Candidatus Kaiserbacteria bacterium]